MADSDSYTSLIEYYGLPKECLTKQVSTKDRAEIAQNGYCKEWRKLPAHLEMMSVVVDDIDRLSVEEDEKRRKFMSQWNSKKGSEATYKNLICALLKFDCKDNAENVCKLLQGNARLLQSPDEQVKPVNSTFPTGKLCGMTLSAKCTMPLPKKPILFHTLDLIPVITVIDPLETDTSRSQEEDTASYLDQRDTNIRYDHREDTTGYAHREGTTGYGKGTTRYDHGEGTTTYAHRAREDTTGYGDGTTRYDHGEGTTWGESTSRQVRKEGTTEHNHGEGIIYDWGGTTSRQDHRLRTTGYDFKESATDGEGIKYDWESRGTPLRQDRREGTTGYDCGEGIMYDWGGRTLQDHGRGTTGEGGITSRQDHITGYKREEGGEGATRYAHNRERSYDQGKVVTTTYDQQEATTGHGMSTGVSMSKTNATQQKPNTPNDSRQQYLAEKERDYYRQVLGFLDHPQSSHRTGMCW